MLHQKAPKLPRFFPNSVIRGFRVNPNIWHTQQPIRLLKSRTLSYSYRLHIKIKKQQHSSLINQTRTYKGGFKAGCSVAEWQRIVKTLTPRMTEENMGKHWDWDRFPHPPQRRRIAAQGVSPVAACPPKRRPLLNRLVSSNTLISLLTPTHQCQLLQ